MKHLKKPTVAQRKMIQERGLNWQNWLVERDTNEEMRLVHRHSSKTRRVIRKEA